MLESQQTKAEKDVRDLGNRKDELKAEWETVRLNP